MCRSESSGEEEGQTKLSFLKNNVDLNSFIDVEGEPGGVAEEERDDDGEEHGSHGGVPAVALGNAVVYQGGSERKV